MNRPALSLTNGILITALVLLALFIAGAALMNKQQGDDVLPYDSEEPYDSAERTYDGAATCGEKNDDCVTSEDCCGNMGLECQQVRTSTGGFGNRCMPVEVMICKSDCGSDGVWAKQAGCRKAVAPKDMARCQDFVGTECKASVHEDRNSRECTDT